LLDLTVKTALPNASAFAGGLALDLKDIKAIIDLMKKNDLSVFEMEKDGFKLKLQKGASERTVLTPVATPVAMPVAAAPAPASSQAAGSPATAAPGAPTEKLREIVSPMVGTFYRAGSPESPSFADIGSEVNEETVVCIIEAMKVMNEIKAETKGVIAEVVAENGKPVQFGQVLFRVR
jgi:acetyl-CoA carboxylase biotin carboxyl carrier protein